jgi:light-regulated signal transduction histidine kinase (bacteriophytochrome)/CheY-like chemotaxis protein
LTVDLTNCDREPIHIIGRIQSFGYLLAVSPHWFIDFASENLSAVIGQPATELIGRSARAILSEDAIHTLRSRLQMLSTPLSVERIFAMELFDRELCDAGAPPQLYDVALHRSGRHVVIEAEPSDTSALAKYVNFVRPMTERVKLASDTRAMCDVAVRQMRALTGFDRVMIYRFADDESGEVIAESRGVGIDSFMGMHFPGADIPQQARALYTKNLLRLIADVADPTVALISSSDPEACEPLDLTMSTLRAVSPIHIEYLGNMGVRASMSASIVRDGKLWGMFTCHHYQPLLLSYPVRTAAELFAESFASLLDQSERKHSQQLAQTAAQVRDELMARLADGSSLISHFDHFAASIAPVIPHDGMAAWIDGEFVSHGEVPDREEFIGLIQFLGTQFSATTGANFVWNSDSLAEAFPPAAAYHQRCAGLLALPVSRRQRDFIVLFRREVSMNKPWAGNPEKDFSVGPNGPRLTPRQSFELWNQSVVGRCQPWSADERHFAEAIRVTLMEVVLRLTDAAAEERERAVRESEFLIAELNHRFRNMLNLVRSLISQSQGSTDNVAEFARNVGNRIESLARAHDQLTHAHLAPVSLHRLIATEARAYTDGKQDAAIIVAGNDVLVAPRAVTTLTLVIHELITNARKYGSLSPQLDGQIGGRLDIATTRDAHDNLVLDWQESGGPLVTPPTRRGFGSTILERSIPHELGGTVSIEYLPAGVVARVALPAQHLVDGNASTKMSETPFTTTAKPSSAAQFATAETSSEPDPDNRPDARPQFTALVVEDNMLIAMDAEEALHELGASEVQLCPNVASALDSIAAVPFDVALLDVNLGDETSESIAMALRTRGTPFVMTTGFGDYVSDISAYAGAPVLTKPYAPAALARALTQVMD